MKAKRTDKHLRFEKIIISKLGIEFLFPFHADELIWMWPWKRTNIKRKWLSILSDGATFETLKELDEFWDDYAKHG